jgi:hypothetical protein
MILHRELRRRRWFGDGGRESQGYLQVGRVSIARSRRISEFGCSFDVSELLRYLKDIKTPEWVRIRKFEKLHTFANAAVGTGDNISKSRHVGLYV